MDEIKKAVVYDGSSVTSPKNWNNPKYGDPCHNLNTDSRNYLVIALEGNGQRPSHQGDGYSKGGKMFTLNTIENHAVCYRIGSYESNSMKSDNPNSGIYETEKSMTLDLNCANPACNQGVNIIVHTCYPLVTGALCANSHPGSYTGQDAFNDMLPVIKDGRKYVVRRLTPLECSRLQGFPDWWTDGVEGSDSNIFRMWGNGIALPCAADVIGRIAKELDK